MSAPNGPTPFRNTGKDSSPQIAISLLSARMSVVCDPGALRYSAQCIRAKLMFKRCGLCSLLHVIDLSVYLFIHTHFTSTRFLTIEVSVEIPTKPTRRIIEPHLLVQPINLLHILILQLKISLEVRRDSALGLAFRQNTPPAQSVSRVSVVYFASRSRTRGVNSPFRNTPG